MHHVESDGLKIAVEVAGDGAPLIFAHGLSGNRHIMRQELAPLADRYQIITYDQRGHGDSTPITDPSLYNAERMADDLRAVLDDLKIERAIIGGEVYGLDYFSALCTQTSAARGKTFAHRARLWDKARIRIGSDLKAWATL